MPKGFRFPDLGEGIAEGELVKWLVKVGDSVQEDQEVAEVETDKALVAIPSPVAGVVEKLHNKEGDRVKVGEVLMSFADAEPASASPAPSPPKEKAANPPSEASSEALPLPEKTPSPTKAQLPPLATPHTRKLARELKVNLEEIKGSGAQGRITEEDVRNFASASSKGAETISLPAGKGMPPVQPPPALSEDFSKFGAVEAVPVKGVRRKISEHMLLASQHTVMVTHMDEAEVDQLLKIRQEKLEYTKSRGVKLTLLPFLMKACVIALRNYPYLNASLVDDTIYLKKYYHFGFAVDTEVGLLVPVIKEVDQKSILRIAADLQTLSQKARDRSIPLEDLRGHSFSISNIGSIGGKAFTPVINYPDSAILGLGRTHEKPVVHEGEIRAASVLPLCLTFDHRVTDGATAARFINEVIKYLQDPDLLLLDYGDA